jgi:hypothetical protein
VDQVPLRRSAKREYETALRQLEKAREQIVQHEKHDLPQYSRWLNSHFGALLTELRELSHALTERRSLLSEIEEEAILGNRSFFRAYEIVMRRRQECEALPNEETPFEGNEEQEQDSSFSEDPLNEQFERLFEQVEDAFSEMFGMGGRRTRKKPETESDGIQRSKSHNRLKELYRAVVRRLHPDALKEMTSQKLEWWHQAQAAYEKSDIHQLEVILSLCEIEEKGTTAHTSLSILQQITRQLKSSFNQLKRELAKHRRDPAWNFSKRKDLDQLAIRIRGSLLEESSALKAELHQIEQQLNVWAKGSQRQKRVSQPSRRRANSEKYQEEFLF